MSVLIWFLPCMNHYKLVKITIFYKRFLTMTSLIWFLPSMSPHMSGKVNYFNKAVITMAAMVWILSWMSHYMLVKFTFYLQRLSHNKKNGMVSHFCLRKLYNTDSNDKVCLHCDSFKILPVYIYTSYKSRTFTLV